MHAFLNRFVPFDAFARWWNILLIGPIAGFLLGRVTNLPFLKPQLVLDRLVAEGPPSRIEVAKVLVIREWKEDTMLSILGLLVACIAIYLLEEVRRFRRSP